MTLYHRRKAATVLEEYGLLAAAELVAHGSQQVGREETVHHLPTTQVLDIDHPYLGELDVLIAGGEGYQPILAALRVVIRLCRRRGGAQHHTGSGGTGEHNRHRPRMVSRRRVLLLEAGLVFLVDDDHAQPGEGQEDGTARAEDYIVGMVGELLAPYLHALGIAVLGVVDAQPRTEDAAQTLHHLHRERNLGHQVEHLLLLFQRAGYQMDVHFGLAARGHSVQQRHLALLHARHHGVIGMGLCGAQCLGLGQGLAHSVVEPAHFHLIYI